MDSSYDYNKYAVLYVDDEEKSLINFTRAFGDQFRILTAANARDGLKLFEQNADGIGLLMTDQRMPGEKGVWLLEKARQLRPRVLRILVTAYADMEAAIAAVNSGAIYKYVTKPWDPPQLDLTLRQALEFFMVQTERDQLLLEKMSVLRNMMIADRIVSLGLVAAGLSHQIRNSLVAVKTFLDLAPVKMAEEKGAVDGLRNPEFWKDYHQNVQSQVEKINSLLKDLWTASDNKSGVPFADQIRLHEIIGGLVESFQAEFKARDVQIIHAIPESLPKLTVDGPKFKRLLELLLKDELAMLPSGCHVTLSAENRTLDHRPHIFIYLTDDGPALPQDALRVIFDPFVVSNSVPSEYGINLLACFFIVHHHGGRIEARSESGRGNIFTISMPLNPERPQAAASETEFLRKALLNEKLWDKLLASG
jgi:two-component system probable response regulator PhcQ